VSASAAPPVAAVVAVAAVRPAVAGDSLLRVLGLLWGGDQDPLRFPRMWRDGRLVVLCLLSWLLSYFSPSSTRLVGWGRPLFSRVLGWGEVGPPGPWRRLLLSPGFWPASSTRDQGPPSRVGGCSRYLALRGVVPGTPPPFCGPPPAF